MRARNIKEDASLNLCSVFSELHHSNPIPHAHGADACRSPSSQQSLRTQHLPPSNAGKEPTANTPERFCPGRTTIPCSGARYPRGWQEDHSLRYLKKPCETMYPKSVNGSARDPLFCTQKLTANTALFLNLLPRKHDFLEDLF